MSENMITCQICGAKIHAVSLHLKQDHGDWTIQRYQAEYPAAPLLSKFAEDRVAKARSEKVAMATPAAPEAPSSSDEDAKSPLTVASVIKRVKRPLHEVFKLGEVAAAKNARGEPIMITTIDGGHERQDMVPKEDPAYIFNIDLLKTVMMGYELNIPIYLFGHAGTGKSTIYEQICHFLNWPMIRIQHSANTEEAHIIGQILANERGTYFEPGILPICMRYGLAYLADEYDRAMPGILSVYQPVLEGKPLIIKEAPPEWRVVEPHPNFRFLANGNTNGSGDESGLYPSTTMQDHSNYSRFAICEHVDYMPAAQEKRVLQAKAGVSKEDADKLIEFAEMVRKRYAAGDLTNPIGPRELIHAAQLGVRRASYRAGIKLAFSNRLPQRSRQAVDDVAQRIFGGAA